MFTAVHVLYFAGLLPGFSQSPSHSWFFALDVDRGLPEWFQYLKEAACVALFGVLAVRTRRPHYAGWCALFGYLALDDSLGLHEELGWRLAVRLGLKPLVGIAPYDLGELGVVAITGGILFSAIALAYWHGTAAFRIRSRGLTYRLGLLVLFGVVVDVLHSMAPAFLSSIGGVVEDGGEMIAMSIVTAYVVAWAKSEFRQGTESGFSNIDTAASPALSNAPHRSAEPLARRANA